MKSKNNVILPLFVVVFLFLQWKFNFLLLPDWFKIFLILCLFVFTSGYVLTEILFKNIEITFLEKTIISFVIGYTFFSILSFISYLLSLKLTTFILIYFIVNIIVILYRFFTVSYFNSSLTLSVKNEPLVLLSFLIILCFYLSIHYGAWISGDAIIHIPKIRQIVELNKIEYNSIFVKDLKVEQRGHNPIYPLLATISVISHLDCFYIWIYSITLFVPMKLLSFYVTTKTVFNTKFSSLSTLIYFLIEGIFNMSLFSEKEIFWSFGSGMPCVGVVILSVFFPIIIYFIFKFLHTENKNILFVLPFIMFAITLTHMMYYLYTLFAITSFFVFLFIFKKYYPLYYKKLFFILVVTIFPSFLYTAYMTKKINYPLLNPAFQSVTGEVSPGYYPIKFIDKNKNFPIVDPFIGILPTFITKVSFLSIPFLIYKLKKHLGYFYIFSILLSCLFVVLNPLILHVGMKIHPPLQAFYHLVVIIPYIWMFTVFIHDVLELTNKKNKILYYICLTIFIGFFIIKLPSSVEYLSNIQFTSENSIKMFNHFKKLKSVVDNKILPGSVVIMRKDMIWYWPVFFAHFTLTHPNRGLLPPNYDVVNVDKKIEKLLSDPESEESIRFVKNYKIDYVVFENEIVLNKYERVLKMENLVFYKPKF